MGKVIHRKELDAAFKLRPVENLTVDAWADQYRFLSPLVSNMPGKYLTSRIEAARGPMRAATTPGVHTITLKVSTQLMKTTLIENVLGYFIHQDPCPVLLAFPKIDLAKSFSKERLAPMVRATPCLRDLLGDVTKDRSEQSLSYKQFPGGFVALVSAGTASDLAMRPIRVTLADEIDKMEDLKFEGDPLALLEERTATFDKPLHLRCCSPTLDETSRIDQSYKDSDQRRAFVACPHCQHEQTLEFFKHVQWHKSDDGREHFPLTAAIYCESCGAAWTEEQRRKIITTQGAVRWYQTRVFKCCDVEQDPQKTRNWDWSEDDQCGYATCSECGKRAVPHAHAGFTAGKVLSPHHTIVELAEQWIKSKDDLSLRQVFFNTVLGQAFTATAAKKVEAHILADRREKFGDKLPKGIIRLTCGVDTHPDRLELHVVGWGYPEEAWSVYYKILPGDPTKPYVWDDLDKFLQRAWPSEWGINLSISATCVDTGGHSTQQAYNFCQPRAHRNIWAVKGSSWAKRGDPVWPIPKAFGSHKRKKKADLGFKPFIIAQDTAKDRIRSMLLIDEVGPGYFHIPEEREIGWLAQLTNEQCVFEKKAGHTIRKWILPKGLANEAFDTTIYAYAALCGLQAVRGLKLEKLAAEFFTQLGKKDDPS